MRKYPHGRKEWAEYGRILETESLAFWRKWGFRALLIAFGTSVHVQEKIAEEMKRAEQGRREPVTVGEVLKELEREIRTWIPPAILEAWEKANAHRR